MVNPGQRTSLEAWRKEWRKQRSQSASICRTYLRCQVEGRRLVSSRPSTWTKRYNQVVRPRAASSKERRVAGICGETNQLPSRIYVTARHDDKLYLVRNCVRLWCCVSPLRLELKIEQQKVHQLETTLGPWASQRTAAFDQLPVHRSATSVYRDHWKAKKSSL
jgi:hypothetical protein